MSEMVEVINSGGIVSTLMLVAITIIGGYVKGWWVPKRDYDDVLRVAKQWELSSKHWQSNVEKAVLIADKVARHVETRRRVTTVSGHVRPKFRVHEGRGWPYDELYGLLDAPPEETASAETELFNGEVRE